MTMMKRRLGLGAALLTAAMLAACGTTPQYQPTGPHPLFQSMTAPGTVVDAATAASVISDYRQANGLGPVTLDPVLMRLAQEQADAMARADKLSHNLNGTPGNRARAAGYKFAAIAENVGAGHDTLADAFAGWRDSTAHRKNMLMPQVTRIGIAVQQAPNTRYKVYWAMIVAAPAPVGAVPVTALQGGGNGGGPWANRWNSFSHSRTVVTGAVPGGVQVTE